MESGRPDRYRRVMPGTIFVVLLLLIIGWTSTGCEKRTRYMVLSTVFDGVPDPDAPPKEEPGNIKLAQAGGQKGQPQGPTKTYKHPPAEGSDDCTFCHGKNMMVQPPKGLCVKCHSHVHKNLKFIHPPAETACTTCHDVHEGPSQYLLRKSPPALCLKCHDKGTENKPCSRPDTRETDCLTCHEPHGGRDKFYLVKDENTQDTNPPGVLRVNEKYKVDLKSPEGEKTQADVKGPDGGKPQGDVKTQDEGKAQGDVKSQEGEKSQGDGKTQDTNTQEQPKSGGG